MSEKELQTLGETIARGMRICQKEILTFNEAVDYTGIPANMLYKLTSRRDIPHYKRPGGRSLFFKRAELDEWMTSDRVTTNRELNEMAANYVDRTGSNFFKRVNNPIPPTIP